MGSQRVKIQISKGYRACMTLEMLNALQREPQWADLNVRHKPISCLPCPVALIAWHNAVKITCMDMFVPVAN